MGHEQTKTEYEQFKQRGLKLDMSRGKPSPEQLSLSAPLLGGLSDFRAADGTDVRNYGGVLGLPEARALFGELLELPPEQVVVGGNASLALMHDTIAFALLHGVAGHAPWRSLPEIAFLCPVPGYDRHFAICQSLGIRMIPVPLRADGPDVAQIARLVAEDASIKGIWCVPKYANPTGAVYGSDVVEALASLESAAPDFRIFWDDAYRLHHLTDRKHAVPSILAAGERAGHPDRAFVYASTSKVTFAGAGIAALAASARNIAWWQKHVSVQTIGPDKVNQLRHVRFLKDRAHVEQLMEKHRALLAPKFAAVVTEFERSLSGVPGVAWTRPEGGYFIDLVTPPGRARRTVQLAREAGIVLTPAGASFPYGDDPEDKHLRIAPSFPSLDEITQAAHGIALALKLAVSE